MRRLIVVSGEDCVRALVRDDFHLVAAYGWSVDLRRGGGQRVHVPLVPELQENVLEEILERAGVPALRFVANLVFIHHETRDFRQTRSRSNA